MLGAQSAIDQDQSCLCTTTASVVHPSLRKIVHSGSEQDLDGTVVVIDLRRTEFIDTEKAHGQNIEQLRAVKDLEIWNEWSVSANKPKHGSGMLPLVDRGGCPTCRGANSSTWQAWM